jgi:predicted MFS family arabinose efflux permease
MSALGYLSIEYLYFIGLSTGILNVFFDVSCQSFLPSLVRRDQLMEGNNLLSISESAANLVGPGIAGCLVKLVAAQEAIAFDALSFLTSAVLLGLIRTPEEIPIHTGHTNIWSEIGEGLRYLWKNQLLRAIALSTSTYNLFYNISMSVYIIHVTRNLGIEPNVLGILLAIGGVGTLLGSLTVQRITNTIGIGATIIGATIIGGIGAIFIPLSSSLEAFAAPMLVIAGFLEGLCDVLININEATLRQSLMPLSLQGRTNASLRWLYWGIFPIGSLLGGLMGETIGVRNTLWIGASGTLLATAWVFFSPIRWLEKLPLPIID